MSALKMIDEIINLFLTNKKWIFSTLLVIIGSVYFGYKRLKIMRRKEKMDIEDFNNKKINFSIYLHQGYRLFDDNKEGVKYLLFNIDILNKSASKITITPLVHVKIKSNPNKIVLQHERQLFIEEYHKNIEKLDNNISLEERGKKTGWIIFEIPKEIVDKRIDVIEVICQDTNSNEVKADFYLLKDLYYENKNN